MSNFPRRLVVRICLGSPHSAPNKINDLAHLEKGCSAPRYFRIVASFRSEYSNSGIIRSKSTKDADYVHFALFGIINISRQHFEKENQFMTKVHIDVTEETLKPI